MAVLAVRFVKFQRTGQWAIRKPIRSDPQTSNFLILRVKKKKKETNPSFLHKGPKKGVD